MLTNPPLQQGYDAACDVWSLGVLLFTMLAGETPFATGPEDSAEDILQRIGKGQYDMDSGNWQSVSNLAKNLGWYYWTLTRDNSTLTVTAMLDVNPSKRLTTNQILAHPWMTSRNQPTTNLLRQDSQHLKVRKIFFAGVLLHDCLLRPLSAQPFKL